MKRLVSWISAVAAVCLFSTSALVADEAKGKPDWSYKDIVDTKFVAAYATVPPKADVVLVDSRPARKYNKGHIVPAINISNSQFEKMTDLLPAEKSNLLIFYCGGVKCPLSHKSAAKA